MFPGACRGATPPPGTGREDFHEKSIPGNYYRYAAHSVLCDVSLGAMDSHKPVLSIYELPETASADGDLSKWAGVPAVIALRLIGFARTPAGRRSHG